MSTTPTSRSSSRPRPTRSARSGRCGTPGSTWTWTARTSSPCSTRTPTTRCASPTSSCARPQTKLLALLDRAHELVGDAHRVVGVLVLHGDDVLAVQGQVEAGVTQGPDLVLLAGLGLDELLD